MFSERFAVGGRFGADSDDLKLIRHRPHGGHLAVRMFMADSDLCNFNAFFHFSLFFLLYIFHIVFVFSGQERSFSMIRARPRIASL